jgi:ABC-2 type transport system permease protein
MPHSVDNLMKHFRVLRRLWAISIQKSLVFRWQFVTDLIDEGASVFVSLLTFDIAYSHVPTIGGWSQPQAILLIGVFQLHSVVINVVFMNSLFLISRTVFLGKLDGLLLRPVSTRLLLSFREMHFVGLLRLIPGIAIITYALDQMGYTPAFTDILIAGVLFVLGIVIVYGMWFASLTIEFWIEGLWSMEEFVPNAFRFGQYPDGIYTGMTKMAFLTILPVIVVANYPTHSLMGNWTGGMLWHAAGLAFVMLAVCHIQWRVALRRYSSASS